MDEDYSKMEKREKRGKRRKLLPFRK